MLIFKVVLLIVNTTFFHALFYIHVFLESRKTDGKTLILRGFAPHFKIPHDTGEALGVICQALPLSSVAVLIQQDNYTSSGLEQDRATDLLHSLHAHGVQLILFYDTEKVFLNNFHKIINI